MEIEKQLLLPHPSAPFSFGRHPDFKGSFKAHKRFVYRCIKEGRFDVSLAGFKIDLKNIADPRHPEVFVIPRNGYFCAVDEIGDEVGFEKTDFPFSSTDFYADVHEPGLFYDLWHAGAFGRLNWINQLGYLVPPRPEEWDRKVRISYTLPQFFNNRLMHSLLVAMMAEVILARNGFSKEERDPRVLTAGGHDIATPAGGDSIKRVDPKGLDEEENFSWMLKHYGLDKLWSEKYGFDLTTAQRWVKGEEIFGQLLDAIDKMCYTALDCYQLGLVRAGNIRTHCLQHPLVMDVWQDIQFTPDRTTFAFSDPERLFLFLLLRAYEHQDLLLNPYSRTLDLFLKKLVKPLYKRGIITKEQLLTENDGWLHNILSKYYPREVTWIIEPEEFIWARFKTREEQRDFCAKLGSSVDHTDCVFEFSTCLDWPILKRGEIVPLWRVISQDKVELLEEIANSTRGYYVYYRA